MNIIVLNKLDPPRPADTFFLTAHELNRRQSSSPVSTVMGFHCVELVFALVELCDGRDD